MIVEQVEEMRGKDKLNLQTTKRTKQTHTRKEQNRKIGQADNKTFDKDQLLM